MDTERLAQLRLQIDHIDGRLVQLLNERATVALEIGTIKKEAPVYDPSREQAVIDNAQNCNDGPLLPEDVGTIMAAIIGACRGLQQSQRPTPPGA